MNIIAGITDIPLNAGSFKTSIDQVINIAAPKSFTARDVAKLRRDCEILLERIKSNPKKIQTLLKLASSGNRTAVQAIAKELKLTEKDFEQEGGGCWMLLWFIIVILAFALIPEENPLEE